THTVSASIAHPNDLMFYKYRDVDEDWVVIAIKRRVLWKSECMFFKHNAADGTMSALEDHEVKGVGALQALYDEIDGFDSRAEQQLEDYDPTDRQAEVLIEDGVAVEDLLGVFVSNRMVKKKCKDMLGDVQIK
ncbi:DarT ssDNA thymidine ADP-ribosyltransferase family protein, partial [Vibrio parahaemolyticus]|uniref:DarT ssDNA thymidine ADP-ribosyltransferase family protein n=1 Tax=Vibrio parahaemolyticus TaxID=670 RepID=UPI0011207B32